MLETPVKRLMRYDGAANEDVFNCWRRTEIYERNPPSPQKKAFGEFLLFLSPYQTLGGVHRSIQKSRENAMCQAELSGECGESPGSLGCK